MYTIRTILGTKFGLTVSGVKNSVVAEPAGSPESSGEFADRKAYLKLLEIKNQMDAYVSARPDEAKRLLTAAKARLDSGKIQKGADELKKLMLQLDTAIFNNNAGKLKDAAGNPKASDGLKDGVEGVIKGTKVATLGAIPAGAPEASQNALRPAPDSQNPQIRAIVDGYTGKMVEKRYLLSAISRAEANFGGYATVYERVTGEKPSTDTIADSQKFSISLDTNITYLQQFVGGNAGLDALLSGKVDIYVKKVAESIKSTGKIPTVNVPSEGLSPQAQTIAGAIATVLVAAGTAGIVTVGHEADRVQADTFVEKFKKDAEGGALNTLGNALTWIKEAFMGRKLSITLGANDREGNVEKYYDAIKNFTKTIMSTPDLASSDNPLIQKIYTDTKKFADAAGIKSTDEIYKKAIIQTYIMNEAYTREGVDWKANIGLFFVGAGRESIQVKTTNTLASKYNKIESGLMERAADTTEIQSNGITITKNPEGKWVHTIPATVQFKGDIAPLSVSYKDNVQDGKYTIVTDTVQSLHFSDNGNGYELTVTPLAKQPTGDTATVSADVTQKQEAAKVENIRDKKSFDERLFYIGHANPEVFGPLLRALGAQDIKTAKSELEKLTKSGNYRVLARELLRDFDKNAQSLTTFTYGTKNLRALDNVTQKQYNETRNSRTLAAEKRLAEQNGIKFTTPESEFKSEKYTPVQMSMVYPGQAMTLMTFATPLVRTENPKGEGVKESQGVHRIDTMDGSFAVHNKIVTLTDSTQRSEVIDATVKLVKNNERGVVGQLENLNKFLKKNGITTEVKMDSYVQYLKSGKIEDIGIAGLSVQAGKETKVIEARAMIAGNKCLNRTNGIIYPLFEIGGVKQSSNPQVSLDYTTPTNINTVDASLSAIGINPIAVATRNRGGKEDTPTDDTPTKPEPTPGPTPEPRPRPETPPTTPTPVKTPVTRPGGSEGVVTSPGTTAPGTGGAVSPGGGTTSTTNPGGL